MKTEDCIEAFDNLLSKEIVQNGRMITIKFGDYYLAEWALQYAKKALEAMKSKEAKKKSNKIIKQSIDL